MKMFCKTILNHIMSLDFCFETFVPKVFKGSLTHRLVDLVSKSTFQCHVDMDVELTNVDHTCMKSFAI